MLEGETFEQEQAAKTGTEAGVKLDTGKPQVFRGVLAYFPRAIQGAAAVSSFGANKYTWNGWQSVDDGVARYTDAMARHMLKEGQGEVFDSESGLPHAAHILWNALARLELMYRNGQLPEPS